MEYPGYCTAEVGNSGGTYKLPCICISDCVETVYELPLLPNGAARVTFSRKSKAVQRVDWIFYSDPSLAVTGRIRDIVQKVLQSYLKQAVVTAPVTSRFSSLSHSWWKPLLEIQ